MGVKGRGRRVYPLAMPWSLLSHLSRTIGERLPGLIALCWSLPAVALQPLAELEAAAEAQGVEPVAITLAAVGDVMMHDSQVRAARGEDGRYRIEHAFDPVRTMLTGADIAFANLEAPLGGEDMAYSGYPTFNAPRAMATALARAGFDVMQTANNHCMDRREKGLVRTLLALDAEGLLHVGTRADPEQSPALWMEVAGLQIAFLAYTFSTNGIPLPPGREGIVSGIDREVMLDDIAAVRGEGADLVVLGCHWGQEYRHAPEAETVALAHDLIEGGADVILGGHPHYIQPYELLSTEDGREGFVIYSLGNFISNMRKRYQDAGMVLLLTFEVVPGGVGLADVAYVPTWVDATDELGRVHHQVVAIHEALPTCGHSPRLDSRDCARMSQALSDTREILGEQDEVVAPPRPPLVDPTGGEEAAAP